MKLPLILLAFVGLVWSLERKPSNAPSKETFIIQLTPWESKVIQVKDLEETDKTQQNEWDFVNPRPTQAMPNTTTTTSTRPTQAKPNTTTTTSTRPTQAMPNTTTTTSTRPTQAMPNTTTTTSTRPTQAKPNTTTTTANTPVMEAKPTTTTTTANTPVTGSHISIDLTQRLFFADYQDSQFRRKTLDLSGLDLSGDDVMKALHGLNSTVLGSIARLDLSRNRLTGLPPRVWPVELEYSLRELRLDHNRLYMEYPDNRRKTHFELLRLISLKKLSLAHCGLTTPTSEVMLEYPRWLESLDLSGNRLYDPPRSLAALANLEHLDLSGNLIRYLGASPLNKLTKLRSLNLSHNGLERMWDDPLEELYALDTLHLENNSLSEPPKLYQYPPLGSYQPRFEVYASHNPFSCNCEFENFLGIGRVQIMDNINVTCLDSNGVEWSLGAAPRGQCLYPKHLWANVKEKWAGAEGWVRDNKPDWSTLYRSLGWVLFGVTLGLVYAHRRAKKSPAPAQVPYNILDDNAANY